MRFVRKRPWSAILTALLLVFGCGHTQAPPSRPAPSSGAAVGPGAVLRAQARAFAKAGDDVRAEQYFNAARRAELPDAEVLPELIALCIRASRLRAATTYALEGLRAEPTDARLAYLVASLYAALGQSPDALHMLGQATRYAPQWAEPHYLRAQLLRDRFADYAAASQAFAQYIALAPTGVHHDEARTFVQAHAPQTPSRRRDTR